MPPPLSPRVFQLCRRSRVAWFSTFQLTTTCRNRPISPSRRIARARCQVASSGKLKSIMPGWPAARARSSIDLAPARSAASGFSTNTGLPRSSARSAMSGCRSGGTAIATASTDGIIDQRPPVADAARNIRGPRELGRARRIGAGERHHLAARIGAERREEDGAAIVAADDTDADHLRRLPLRRTAARAHPYRFRSACRPILRRRRYHMRAP